MQNYGSVKLSFHYKIRNRNYTLLFPEGGFFITKGETMLKNKITLLYCKLLGEAIKQQMLEQEIAQNDISSYYNYNDEVELISTPTVNQILKGKRNMTLTVANAFQDRLELPNVKSLFFPDINFCRLLITHLIQLILNDEYFSGSATQRLFKTKQKLIQKDLQSLAIALYNFFPDFPEEETSYQIANSISEWLIEFVAHVAHLKPLSFQNS